MNQEKFDRIVTWTNEDALPVDRPDLIDNGASNANFSPNLVQRGVTNLTVNAQVRNVGTAAAGTYCVAFYASLNTTITTLDHLLGSDCVGTAVAPFSNVNVSFTGDVPASVPAGTYYIGWIIDSTDNQNEFAENNNTGYESQEQVVVEVVPTLSVNNDTGLEGGLVSFTVTLSPASSFTVNVTYNTQGALDADAGIDYTVPGFTVLTFTPGQLTKTVNIATIEDTLDENNEQFNLVLSSPVNATIADGTGVGTITDDDPLPAISVNNDTALEGAAVSFTVTLTPASGRDVTVTYNTQGVLDADPGVDYTVPGFTVLTFTPGQVSKIVNIATIQDTLDENNEQFHLVLSTPVNGTIADGTGIGTITDNDPLPAISVNNDTVAEGGIAQFTITLTPVSGRDVTVTYATSNGTAVAPGDYTAIGATAVVFTAGQTSKLVNVTTINDVADELAETLNLDLSLPINATISDNLGVGTITDNDGPPSITVNDVTVAEGNAGTTNFNFTVSLSAATGNTVTVNYNAVGATALTGFDFTGLGTTGLTFLPGETSKPVTVVVNGDTTCEGSETFNVNLGGALNASIADNLGVGTITNDDGVCVNGGKGLTITATGARDKNLNWTGGNAQTGYQLVQYNTVTAVANLIPLGGGVTSFNDAAGGAVMFCYVLAATTDGGAVLGLSDLECALPGQETGGAVPTNFNLKLDQTSNATMSWTNAGGVTTLLLQVIPLNGAAITTINLGPATTNTVQPVVVPDGTCFQLLAFSGAALSTSNVVCGIPGVSTLSVGGGKTPGTMQEAVEIVKKKAGALNKRMGAKR